MNENILKLDTAIIGGGITGLYACLKLREMKGADHTIALFEMSDRFGGRIETVEMERFWQNMDRCDLRDTDSRSSCS